MMDRELVTLLYTAGILLVVTLWCIWYHHPKYGKNRGPKVYPLLGSYLSLLHNKSRILDWMVDLIRDSPTMTVRTVRPGGRQFHITANPANVEHILKTNFENYPKGENSYANLHDLLGNGIFNIDGKSWKLQRKVASHEFTTQSLKNFMVGAVHDELRGRFIPVLQECCNTGRTVDLQDLLARFTFDTICKLGFGVDPACLDLCFPSVRFANAFDTATSITANRFITFASVWKTMRALNVGSEKKLRAAVADIDDFAMFVIQNRRKQVAGQSNRQTDNSSDADDAAHLDLLSRFMGLTAADQDRRDFDTQDPSCDQNEGPQLGYSDEFLRDIVISFILAGRDTSTSSLTWFFWNLEHHRQVEDAICKEVSEILKNRLVEDKDHNKHVPTSFFSFEELKKMHYLHAAVSESLRLYPPVPIEMKLAHSSDEWPDGTRIDPNSTIIYHPYAMGRMERIWGPDCMKFKPERWLKDGVFVQESPYKHAVFQVIGDCVGDNFATCMTPFLLSEDAITSDIFMLQWVAREVTKHVEMPSFLIRIIIVMIHSCGKLFVAV